MINFTDNKKLNIKINILLAAIKNNDINIEKLCESLNL